MRCAFIFPGQGSQAVGMGKDLANIYSEARCVFEEVDEALNQNLSKIIFDGPNEDLTLTENAQPALLAVSMALVRVLERVVGFDVAGGCICVAGHSLGEYSALTATQTFDVPNAARILRVRGEAMQNAVPIGKGAMAALIGVDLDVAEVVASEAAAGEVCVVANDNTTGQLVLSGSTGAITRALKIAKGKGVKRCILLPVSAPFHCELMAPAADVVQGVLDTIRFEIPSVPIISNVTATPEKDPGKLKNLLVEQVTSRVRWRESILRMKKLGVETFVEVGSGKVLTGMVRRIDRGLTGFSIQSPNDIDRFASVI